MNKFILLLILPLFWACPASLNDILYETPLSKDEVARGLKQALSIGADEAVDFLAVEEGFYNSAYKILLPEEARQVTDKLKLIPGFDKVEDVLIKKINDAASDAVSKATPILIDAITEMTFQDAMNILLGSQDAATQYLHTSSYDKLYGEFQPVLFNSLEEFQVVSYWEELSTKYNEIPFLSDVNTRLDDYIAHESLSALFDLIELKEEKIRSDVSARSTQLLQRVFAKQD